MPVQNKHTEQHTEQWASFKVHYSGPALNHILFLLLLTEYIIISYKGSQTTQRK